MNILVLGNGGREEALGIKSLKSTLVNKVYIIPGNSGMNENLICFENFDSENFEVLHKFCIENQIQLIIVGNEKYLEKGVVDFFRKTDIKIFGPSIKEAQIETSKAFAKNLMQKYNIPTAKYDIFENEADAIKFLNNCNFPVVIKQDGLALGKGVLVGYSYDEAEQFIIESFKTNTKVIFEEFLDGKEFSLLVFANGDVLTPMITARDYKRSMNNDKGLNTGGMGCYCPVEYVTEEDFDFSISNIVKKTLQALKTEGISYTGILYAGLIKTKHGIKVIEFNARFGDPETEVLLEHMDSDIIEIILSILDSQPYKISWKKGVTLGVCLATIGYPLSYEKLYPISGLSNINFYSMAVKKEANNYYTNGGRVVFVYESKDSLENTRKAVYEKIKFINSKGLFYRTDIGL